MHIGRYKMPGQFIPRGLHHFVRVFHSQSDLVGVLQIACTTNQVTLIM